jgi:acetamidase/formamidase
VAGAETKTRDISMGGREALERARKRVIREIIGFLCVRTGLTDANACAFCSLADVSTPHEP